jgi:transposase
MHSEQIKNVAIKLYKKFNSYRKVANLLDISKSVIHYWINYKYIPRTTLINLSKICKFIEKSLVKNSYITINEIKNNIFKKFNNKISISFIRTIIIKKLNYSYKKVSNKMYNKNLPELLKQKKIFKQKHSNYKDIICIDETYVHSNIHNKYGWSMSGSRLVHYCKSNPIKYSVIVAISCNKIEHSLIEKQNINKEIYKKFIQQLCLIHKNKKFLMDNVSFHKSKEIIQIINDSSNEALFIPPYSPEFNPIEEVFSLFKRQLVKNFNGTIIFRIKKTIRNLMNTNFENYYKHSFQD